MKLLSTVTPTATLAAKTMAAPEPAPVVCGFITNDMFLPSPERAKAWFDANAKGRHGFRVVPATGCRRGDDQGGGPWSAPAASVAAFVVSISVGRGGGTPESLVGKVVVGAASARDVGAKELRVAKKFAMDNLGVLLRRTMDGPPKAGRYEGTVVLLDEATGYKK